MWFRPTVDDLKAKRAGKVARLDEVRRQMGALKSFPGYLLSDSQRLAEEIAVLDYKIERMEKK